MAIFNRRTRKGVFEISSDNGLISIYALCRVRGEGGKKPACRPPYRPLGRLTPLLEDGILDGFSFKQTAQASAC